MVTMLTFDTTATRNPAAITGTATGSSTRSSRCQFAVPHRLGGGHGVVRHRAQPVGDDTYQQRQGVKRKRDNDVDRIEDLRPENDRQNDEQRQRRNRVEQARGSDDGRVPAPPSMSPPPERERKDETEDRRCQRQPDVADGERRRCDRSSTRSSSCRRPRVLGAPDRVDDVVVGGGTEQHSRLVGDHTASTRTRQSRVEQVAQRIAPPGRRGAEVDVTVLHGVAAHDSRCRPSRSVRCRRRPPGPTVRWRLESSTRFVPQ